MNIIVFDNSGLIEKEGDYCVEMGTGNFAKELKFLGHKVTFYGQSIQGVKNTTDVFPLKKNGIEVIAVKRLKNKFFSYLRIYFLALKPIFKAEAVYFYYPSALKFLIFICILCNKKYGLYIRGVDDLKTWESRIFYKRASFVLTVADYFTNFVNGVVKRNIASNIRPMIRFNENDIVWERKYSKNKPFVLLYIGRMANDKGIAELIHATSRLRSLGFFVTAKLIGDGEYINDLKRLSSSLKLDDTTVEFVGPVFDKNEIIKRHLDADLFVLPTYHEGFPRTLYEAMILGTPIVTTFVGGISGVMTNDVNCFRIEERSVISLQDSIISALNGYERFVYYADNAKDTVYQILNERKKTHAELLNDRLVL
jgi:glycosyltransferase involved in cell wall biosynthesis